MSAIVRPPKMVVSPKPIQAPPTLPEQPPTPPAPTEVPVPQLLMQAKASLDRLAAAILEVEDAEKVREDRNEWRAQAIEKEAVIAAKDKEIAELRLLLSEAKIEVPPAKQ
jgi:hypothetical protein